MPALRILLVTMVFITGCRQDMQDQPRFKPLQRSNFFADGRSARPLPTGTIARGHLELNAAFATGKSNGEFVDTLPVTVDRGLLQRGQDRYNIYCSPCHSRVGDGRGMIALRGFRYPPSFHDDRLRGAPLGYLYAVVSNGYGAMPDYSYQIEPRDRWAVVAYVRVLQLSQGATIADLDAAGRQQLGIEGGARQ